MTLTVIPVDPPSPIELSHDHLMKATQDIKDLSALVLGLTFHEYGIPISDYNKEDEIKQAINLFRSIEASLKEAELLLWEEE